MEESNRNCWDLAKSRSHHHVVSYDPVSEVDLTLQSSDGVLFRVHSSVMTLSSTVFHDMHLLPRDSADVPEAPIELDELAESLKRVLDVIYFKRDAVQRLLSPTSAVSPSSSSPLSRWAPSLIFEDLLRVADKYDMPPVFEFLKRYTVENAQATRSWMVLEIYEFAYAQGWEDVALDIACHAVAVLHLSHSSAMTKRRLKEMDRRAVLILENVIRQRESAVKLSRQSDAPD